ncbi:GRF1-interacting factor 1 [Gastrolobium bilobum]|uniref:GRF1-interacting factor 1 n=1 Tax=Gastrolobium bilobum TaxID=150636 RepID=UPI002AB12FA1|nr:GRF1-interacting factor 1 [Gastrolobium bilobum]
MQQHLMQMQPMMAAYYPNNVTTDHIQQFLDENKSLILKIVESQNAGKMNECAENQARLQRNLMYLAAIADSQPQPPTMPGQYPPGGMMQQGAHYLQGQQAQQLTQQQLMAARSSLLYTQQPYSALQQQQALHSQLGMNSGGGSQGLHMLHGDGNNVNVGGSATMSSGGFPDFARGSSGEGLHSAGRGIIGSSKHDIGSSSEGRNAGEGGENLYLKSADDGN